MAPVNHPHTAWFGGGCQAGAASSPLLARMLSAMRGANVVVEPPLLVQALDKNEESCRGYVPNEELVR